MHFLKAHALLNSKLLKGRNRREIQSTRFFDLFSIIKGQFFFSFQFCVTCSLDDNHSLLARILVAF